MDLIEVYKLDDNSLVYAKFNDNQTTNEINNEIESLGLNSSNYEKKITLDWDVIDKRKKEYPDIEEVIEIILDYGFDSPEFIDLMNKRSEIKKKYPKG